MKYLNPKADLTFKKVFGEHLNLVKSLLNALLPFDGPEEEIDEIDYLTPELVPDTPLKKLSIVDVRCKDRRGRQFIVEMQMLWSSSFMQRVLFNASKAYVRQLGSSVQYELLQPVYSLSLVNDVFAPELENYYHDYRIVQVEHTDKVIEGLRFIFVELPKFTPHTFHEKKMQVLWLRYLTEIDDLTENVSPDLLENPDIREALTQIEQSAFNDAQMMGYDEFWDAVRVENTIINDARKKGLKEGMEEGMKKGMKKGMEEGMKEGMKKGMKEGKREQQFQIAANLKQMGASLEFIAQATGLSIPDIEKL